MSEILNVNKLLQDKDSILGHFILGLSSGENINELIAIEGYDSKKAKVLITIEGVPMVEKTLQECFEYVFEAMCREFIEPNKENIQEAATKLLKDKLFNIGDRLQDLDDQAEHLCSEIFDSPETFGGRLEIEKATRREMMLKFNAKVDKYVAGYLERGVHIGASAEQNLKYTKEEIEHGKEN